MAAGRRELTRILLRLGLSSDAAAAALGAMLGSISAALEARQTVAIRGFGSFHFKQGRRTRMWDPATGRHREVSSGTLVRFRPASGFRSRLKDDG